MEDLSNSRTKKKGFFFRDLPKLFSFFRPKTLPGLFRSQRKLKKTVKKSAKIGEALVNEFGSASQKQKAATARKVVDTISGAGTKKPLPGARLRKHIQNDSVYPRRTHVYLLTTTFDRVSGSCSKLPVLPVAHEWLMSGS